MLNELKQVYKEIDKSKKQKESFKKYYEKNKEEIKEYQKEYYENNREKLKEKSKEYYEKKKILNN